MGILDCASGASVGRGYNYYKAKKVLSIEEIDKNVFTALVAGRAEKPYVVEMNSVHPKKSRCNCPHADGTNVTCKHIVAAYFAAYPAEAERFYKEAIEYQEEQEHKQAMLEDRVASYVRKMKKSELQHTLLDILFCGSEQQFRWFVDSNGLADDL